MTTPRKECVRHRCDRTAKTYGLCRYHYDKQLSVGLITCSLVDAGPARDRIVEQLERGNNFAYLMESSGVDKRTLARIWAGRARVKHYNARKILAAPLIPTHVGIIRRLRALARIGYSRIALQEATGLPHAAVAAAVLDGYFVPRLRARIANAYNQIPHDHPGPSRVAARRAESKGWASPLAWEGIDIDDPDAVPDLGDEVDREPFDEADVLRFLAGDWQWRERDTKGNRKPLTSRERTARDEAIRRLPGRSSWWVSEQIGCTRATVEQVRDQQQSPVTEQDSDTSEGQRAS